MDSLVHCLNAVGIIDRHGRIAEVHRGPDDLVLALRIAWKDNSIRELSLDVPVDAPIDNHQGIKIKNEHLALSTLESPVHDPLILLLEKSRKSRSISAAIRLSSDRDAGVVRRVAGELLEPDLSEMPESESGVDAAEGSRVRFLTGVGSGVRSAKSVVNKSHKSSRRCLTYPT